MAGKPGRPSGTGRLVRDLHVKLVDEYLHESGRTNSSLAADLPFGRTTITRLKPGSKMAELPAIMREIGAVHEGVEEIRHVVERITDLVDLLAEMSLSEAEELAERVEDLVQALTARQLSRVRQAARAWKLANEAESDS